MLFATIALLVQKKDGIMRYLILLAAVFFSFNSQLVASETACKPLASSEFLEVCAGGILGVVSKQLSPKGESFLTPNSEER